MRKKRYILAVLALVILILGLQTIYNKYGDGTLYVWGWFIVNNLIILALPKIRKAIFNTLLVYSILQLFFILLTAFTLDLSIGIISFFNISFLFFIPFQAFIWYKNLSDPSIIEDEEFEDEEHSILDTNIKRVKIFTAYSQSDEIYKLRFIESLAVFKKVLKSKIWDDEQILPGENIENELIKNLDDSDIICLLISPSFIASEYCYSKELKQAVKNHNEGICHVIPILIRPTPFWKNLVFGRLPSFPKNGKPISEWNNVDAAWKSVVEEIGKLLSKYSKD